MKETDYWQESEILSWEEHTPSRLSCLSPCNLTCLSPASSQSYKLPEGVPCRKPHPTGTELWELHVCAPSISWNFRFTSCLWWVIHGHRCSAWHEAVWFLSGVNSVTHVFSTILNFINEFKGVIRKTAAIFWALSGNTKGDQTEYTSTTCLPLALSTDSPNSGKFSVRKLHIVGYNFFFWGDSESRK